MQKTDQQGSLSPAPRWGRIGLLVLGLDVGLFAVLRPLGLGALASHSISFAVAAVVGVALHVTWASRRADHPSRLAACLATCALAYFLRAGTIVRAADVWQWPPLIAALLGIAAGALVGYAGARWFVFPPKDSPGDPAARWRALAVAAVAYSVATRLLYGGVMNLIPEEAYYWNYAQHVDYGYLDHPPMVAWAVWLATALFGDTEQAVRLPALLAWMVAAWFVWKSARLLFDRTVGFVAVALLAGLPVFLLTGLFTTPDAFLYAFWAGCVYFLQCAILLDRPRAWYAVGVFAGLGLLSKYTMGLLGLAVIVFLLMDRRARRWWRRPELYLAVLLAGAVFSPVILWNARNGWASFVFQSSGRLAKAGEFGLFKLLGAMIVLVTPLGLIGSIKAVLPPRLGGVAPRGREFSRRARRLVACMVFVPLAVFVAFSLRHLPKTNWAGIAFLAAVPLLAKDVCRLDPRSGRIVQWGRRMWPATLVGLAMLFGFLGFFSTAGFPGIAPVDGLSVYSPSVWSELSAAAEDIRRRVSQETGLPAAVVGMDKYFLTSELAFYDGTLLGDGAPRVAGRGLFPSIYAGDRGLMWDSWVPRRQLRGRPFVLISFRRENLEHPRLAEHFDPDGVLPIQRQEVRKNGRSITAFYWRECRGYRDPPPE